MVCFFALVKDNLPQKWSLSKQSTCSTLPPIDEDIPLSDSDDDNSREDHVGEEWMANDHIVMMDFASSMDIGFSANAEEFSDFFLDITTPPPRG